MSAMVWISAFFVVTAVFMAGFCIGAVIERREILARAAALASPAPAAHVHGAWCHPSADGCPDDLR